jgi:hypothetical protein
MHIFLWKLIMTTLVADAMGLLHVQQLLYSHLNKNIRLWCWNYPTSTSEKSNFYWKSPAFIEKVWPLSENSHIVRKNPPCELEKSFLCGNFQLEKSTSNWCVLCHAWQEVEPFQQFWWPVNSMKVSNILVLSTYIQYTRVYTDTMQFKIQSQTPTKDGLVCWNRKRWLPFIICRPRKEQSSVFRILFSGSLPFPFTICSKQT